MTKARSLFVPGLICALALLNLSPSFAAHLVQWENPKPVPIELLEQLQTTSETRWRLPNPRPRFLALDFWASWCEPCEKSFPFYEAEAKKWQEHGVLFLGVNVDSQKGLGAKWLAKKKSELPQIYDDKGQLKSFFELKSIPRLVILDRDLKVVRAYRGFYAQSPEVLKKAFKELFVPSKLSTEPKQK